MIGFRALQADSGLLVSASQALQFLRRRYFENSDIDFYVGPGGATPVRAWLETDGYMADSSY